MDIMRIRVLLLLTTWLLGVAAQPAAAGPAPGGLAVNPEQPVITVGRISEDPRKFFPRLRKFADYLAKQLDDEGDRKGGVIVSPNLGEMARQIRNGQVDIISETPFAALRLVESAGAEILLREWKKGVAEYRTVFFARRDSNIKSLSDLVGRKIAFEDPGSTSAFLVPLSVLKRDGFEPVQLPSPRQNPAPGKIGYAFSYGEVNMVTWVATGVTAAGAFSDTDFEEADRTQEKVRKHLQIIHRTEPIIRSVLLVRSDLPSAAKKRIRDILLKAHADPEGQAALTAYAKVKKYDEITGQAAESLERVKTLLDALRQEIN